MKNLHTAAIAATVALSAGLASASPILEWNDALLNAIRTSNTPPPAAARAMAMVNTAMYDAVVSIEGGNRRYATTQRGNSNWSSEAAAAAAAHGVLTSLFGSQSASFDALLSSQLGGLPMNNNTANGAAFGASVASGLLGLRSGDGAGNAVVETGGAAIGQWRPTPPGFANGAVPQYANVTPWLMNSTSQFRAPTPPAVGSAEYIAAYNEVKSLGSLNSATRTAEQTDIARFWAANAGTVTPPGQFLQIGMSLASSQNLSLVETARLMAMLGAGAADAAVSAWDTKYAYEYWRPVTGINLGDTDGSDDTIGDVNWVPLLTTPNHPSYTSGHSTFSGAMSKILELYFGTDNVAFSYTEEATGLTRFFSSFSEAANEAGQSRIYGGIHWQFDNQAGLFAGRSIGEWLFANGYFSVPTPGAATALLAAGVLASRRRRA